MLIIGIYSRDPELVKQLGQLLSFWAAVTCVEVQYKTWLHLGELDETPRTEEDRVLFLDAEDDGPGILKTAERLSVRIPNCEMIFLSNNPRFAIDSYRLHPVGFLKKKVCYQQLERVMNRCIPTLRRTLQWIDIPYHRSRGRLPLNELWCAETDGRYCILHCTWGPIQARCSLGELEAMLPKFPFFRCQKSYIVNFRYVRAREAKCFLMKDGKEIPIGRNYTRLAQERFSDYTSIARTETQE